MINLKAAFNRAVIEGFIQENPCKPLKRIKVPEKLPIFFTEKEFEKLISVIEDADVLDLVKFAVNTGLRQAELINLRWSNINFTEKILILDNNQFITKSKKIRSVPLNKTALEVLNKRKSNFNEEFVFTYRGSKIVQDWLIHHFKKQVRKAGLRKELRFHSLRHTFATWLVQRGVSIYHVSKLLGHADVSTTQIYANLVMSDLKSVVERL
ncbi:MAG: site-specific integrase [Melioribacteraceae bacterium]|nr:site-specific integrase [Melioribacteraceae bacterium]